MENFKIEDEDKNTGCLKVKDVAKAMGKSEMFVRIGLQRGLLPFGTAVRISSKYTYYISPSKFYKYIGIK